MIAFEKNIDAVTINFTYLDIKENYKQENWNFISIYIFTIESLTDGSSSVCAMLAISHV